MRFVSTKRRRRDQWKLRIRPCLKGPVFYSSRTNQDEVETVGFLCARPVDIELNSFN